MGPVSRGVTASALGPRPAPLSLSPRPGETWPRATPHLSELNHLNRNVKCARSEDLGGPAHWGQKRCTNLRIGCALCRLSMRSRCTQRHADARRWLCLVRPSLGGERPCPSVWAVGQGRDKAWECACKTKNSLLPYDTRTLGQATPGPSAGSAPEAQTTKPTAPARRSCV